MARGDGGPLDRPNAMRLRGFVPVDELTPDPPRAMAAAPPAEVQTAMAPEVRTPRPPEVRAPERPPRAVPGRLLPDSTDDWEKRVSLFGEADL